jgi:hypothetical protein
MLICGEIVEIRGEAAPAAGPGAIAPAPLATLFLGGLLLLIGP